MLDALPLTVAIIGTRASFRIRLIAASRSKRSRPGLWRRGDGQMIVHEMRANPQWSMTVAFIDDDLMSASLILACRPRSPGAAGPDDAPLPVDE
jgi:hypothetical protein